MLPSVIHGRKCSPLLAIAAGASICLSGEVADAVNGNIAASNGGDTSFTAHRYGIKLFGSRATFDLVTGPGGGYFSNPKHALRPVFESTTVSKQMVHFNAGVQISTLAGFFTWGYIRKSQSNNYIPMRFDNGGTRYGWVHCISTSSDGKKMRLDTWSFNGTGGGIKTLDESITPKKLALSDGRLKLNWSNTNEAGVARYEVQAKGADGAWAAVDGATPGEGSYAATVRGAGEYRLLVESSDGSSRTVAF